jgi:uncharacterized membrane-anchored protein
LLHGTSLLVLAGTRGKLDNVVGRMRRAKAACKKLHTKHGEMLVDWKQLALSMEMVR